MSAFSLTSALNAITHPRKSDTVYNWRLVILTTVIELPLEFLSFYFHAALIATLSLKLSLMFWNFLGTSRYPNHPESIDSRYYCLDTGINASLLLYFAIHLNPYIMTYFALRSLSTFFTKLLSYYDRTHTQTFFQNMLYDLGVVENLKFIMSYIPFVSFQAEEISLSPKGKVSLQDKIIVISDLPPKEALSELGLDKRGKRIPIIFLSTDQLLSSNDNAKSFSSNLTTLQKLHEDIFKDAEVHLVAKLSGEGHIFETPNGQYTAQTEVLRKLFLGDPTSDSSSTSHENYHMHWVDPEGKHAGMDLRERFLASPACDNPTMREFFSAENCHYHAVEKQRGGFLAKKYDPSSVLHAQFDIIALQDINEPTFQVESLELMTKCNELITDVNWRKWLEAFCLGEIPKELVEINDTLKDSSLNNFTKLLQAQRIAIEARKHCSYFSPKKIIFGYIGNIFNRQPSTSTHISLLETLTALRSIEPNPVPPTKLTSRAAPS